ncbi:MAG: hypothetical protein ACI9SE_001057 [Neolewinella sp.]|jgi:hypothetical protein
MPTVTPAAAGIAVAGVAAGRDEVLERAGEVLKQKCLGPLNQSPSS